jgi:hypothetical protein
MSKKQKTHAVRAKRSKPQGVGGKPTMVATFKKKAMFNPEVNNILENLEKEAKLSGRQRAALGSLVGNTASMATGLPGGGMGGAALGASKGRKLQSAAGDLAGGVAGSALGAGVGRALTRKANPMGQLLGTTGGAMLGNLAGSAAGTYLAHGKDKKTRRKKSAEQKPAGQVKEASAEVEAILDDLEEMHKEAMFGMGRNSRRAMKARARARKRKSLDATRAMRNNARIMGATARAEAAGRSFTNKTKPLGYKSDYMKKKHAPTLMGGVKKVLKTPGGAAIGAGLAGAAIGAATAKPKTVTTTAPDGTKTTTTTKPNRLGRALAAGAGAGLAAGGARLAMKKMASAESNNILSLLQKEAAKKPQVLPKAGWNMVAPVFRGDSKRRERTNMVRKAGIGAGIGAAAGAVRGAVKDPGTNEDGTKKSRLKAIARNAAGGAALGGAAGAGVSAANDRGYSVTMKPRG